MSDAKIGKGLEILVLDDEKDICFFLKEFFSRRGFNVRTALTGEQAVKLVKKIKPDIAILDIYLYKGKMTGLDVLKFIKQSELKCSCVMVTRADEKETIDQAQKLGADDYLIKPLTLLNVEKALDKVVKKIRKRKE